MKRIKWLDIIPIFIFAVSLLASHFLLWIYPLTGDRAFIVIGILFACLSAGAMIFDFARCSQYLGVSIIVVYLLIRILLALFVLTSLH